MQSISPSCTAYNPQTAEDALQPGASSLLVYSISKGLADRAVRDFKLAHPDLDVTTIHPSIVYGPFGSGQVYHSPASGTNRYIYGLISGPSDRPVSGYDTASRAPPLNIDVRDVARAHALASATENVLGLKNYIKWEDTVLDTIDDLLRVEKELAAAAQ